MSRSNQTSTTNIYWPLRAALASGGVIASLLGAHLLAQGNPTAVAEETSPEIPPLSSLATPTTESTTLTLTFDLPPIPTVASPIIGQNGQTNVPTAVDNAPAPLPLQLDLAPIPTLAPLPPAPVAPPPQVAVTQSTSSR